MMTYMDSTPHLDDAELVRLLDREHSPAERARWEAHVAECAHCAAEIDRLRADAGVVRVWLERAAFEEALPHGSAHTRAPRHRAAPWLRAAAVVALLALPVTAIAAIPTLRAWVVAAFAELRGNDVAETSTPATAADAALQDRIRFAPAAGNFTVQLDAAQAVGTLTVTRGDDTVALLDRAGTEAVVSESTLRIRNAPEAVANYVLQVPHTVTSVTVRIGADTGIVLDESALRAGAAIPIRPRPAR